MFRLYVLSANFIPRFTQILPQSIVLFFEVRRLCCNGTPMRPQAQRTNAIKLTNFFLLLQGTAEQRSFALPWNAAPTLELKTRKSGSHCFVAVLNGYVNVCQLLLKADASTAVYLQLGESLLQVAVGSYEVFEEHFPLIRHYEAGGRPSQPSEGSNCAFTARLDHWIATEPVIAMIYDHQDVLEALQEDSLQVETVKLLLDHSCRRRQPLLARHLYTTLSAVQSEHNISWSWALRF